MIIQADLLLRTEVEVNIDDSMNPDESAEEVMAGLLYEGFKQYAKDFDPDVLNQVPEFVITHVSREE